MAKISLRIYNQEIEALVERSQLDEAIAHCLHILNAYPKYLDIYRLIGKAYLEAKRYNEAADIFHRLLMAAPDDFVAHVGMSIINDEQKNLDAAIWHMERAFEVQPSNTAIQSELQRLYGRRDGVAPPKIRLTRGALAYMYMQGELYTQAITEIQSVLEEDQERQDMQVLLARAYFHAGKKTEAAEICDKLIQRYPYCLDANRLLVELLPETESDESAQIYRHRVNELDPYSSFVSGSILRTDEVPADSINLEHLEWKSQPVGLEAGWDTSQGIGLDSAASPLTEESAPVSKDNLDIPAFMREAGWGASTAALPEDASTFDEEAPVQPALEGDLPDWVKAMAPAGVDTSEPAVSSAMSELGDDVPDWLQDLGQEQSQTLEQPLVNENEIPEWLQPAQVEDAEVEDEADPSLAAEGDILESVPFTPLDTGSVFQEEASDTLAQDDLADWELDENSMSERLVPDATDTDDLGASGPGSEDALAWLEGLAAKHGAKPEELLTHPDEHVEHTVSEPDWAQQAEAPGEEVVPVEASEIPAIDGSTDTEDTLGFSAGEKEDAMAWLEGLAAKLDIKPEEPVSQPEERQDTEIDWVQQAQESGLQQAETPPETSVEDTDETGMWLRELGAAEAPKEQQGTAEPQMDAAPMGEVPQEDLPDWLAGLEDQKKEATTTSPSSGLPEWLLREEQESIHPEPIGPADWEPEEKENEPVPASPEQDVLPSQPVQAPGTFPEPPEPPEPVMQDHFDKADTFSATEDPVLTQAQIELTRENISAAMENYGKLIKKGRLLEEVIFDLRKTLYRYPVEVIIWQTLGDAYMRSDRLQEALDAYTKAEELLR